jgi:hypothetical protein
VGPEIVGISLSSVSGDSASGRISEVLSLCWSIGSEGPACDSGSSLKSISGGGIIISVASKSSEGESISSSLCC